MALLDFLNKKHKDEPQQPTSVLPANIYNQNALNFTDTIAPAALKVSARELQIGEKFARTFYTISYPRFLTESWFSPVINMARVFDVGIFIHPVQTETALRNFQRKVAEVQSQIAER